MWFRGDVVFVISHVAHRGWGLIIILNVWVGTSVGTQTRESRRYVATCNVLGKNLFINKC